MSDFDVVVVGLGGAGTSAAMHLSRAGLKVLGLEQFALGHANGSSHGKSRIYRTAYSEGSHYVPLAQRSVVLWEELQARSGLPILERTGGLFIGRRESDLVAGALRSVRDHTLRHELLSPEDVESRYPQFRLRDAELAVWDLDAGVLFPENCLRAHARLAAEKGAELHFGERVRNWNGEAGFVNVRTDARSYRARHLVLTAGAWTGEMAGALRLPLAVERQFVLWFPSRDREMTQPSRMPVFLWQEGTHRVQYGIPDLGDGVKVGSWGTLGVTGPEAVDRHLSEEAARAAREWVAVRLVGVEAHEREHLACLMTNAPDGHFLIGRAPGTPNVVVISACSGHGFKFTSVLGEIARRLTLGEPNDFDLEPFRLTRFDRRAG
jgi:sarcosine oxidase